MIDARTLGELQILRIVDWEAPFFTPHEMFAEAAPEAIAPYRAWLEPRALCAQTGKLILPVQSWLVRTPTQTILIDTCIGNDKTVSWYAPWHKRRDGRWLANLRQAGVGPGDIDVVLCTHLHVDHSGWNTEWREGRWQPTFPNARYIFARREYEAAAAQGGDPFVENVLPIVEAGQAELVDNDHDLDRRIWLQPTPGHTAGHVAVHLASQGKSAVVSGDLIHSPLQCRHPEWNYVYDALPEEARQTRRRFLGDCCGGGVLVLTSHFPSPSVGHVVAADDAFAFRYA